MRMIAAAALLLLLSCSEKQASTAEKPADAPAVAAGSADSRSTREIEVGPKAAALAYAVSQYSPLLSDAQRTAISQDFNGAPLGSAPQVHTVTAESVSCRVRTESVGEGTMCSIDYGAETRNLDGEEAQFLFDALGNAGVESEGGMSHLERALTKLSCTVDDAVAQGTSSTGSEINGFSCRFEPGF